MPASIISPSVEQACRAITALLGKLEHAAEKISQYQSAIGQHIAAIKKARPNDWLKVVRTECDLARRQAYYYLALVSGTKTVEGQRAANAAANKRLRQRQRASRDAQSSRAREHDKNLAEQLRLAEIKITGLPERDRGAEARERGAASAARSRARDPRGPLRGLALRPPGRDRRGAAGRGQTEEGPGAQTPSPA